MSLTGVERDMAKAYVQVHSRKINAHLKAAQGGASARTELELALLEAKGVVAALERLLEPHPVVLPKRQRRTA